MKNMNNKEKGVSVRQVGVLHYMLLGMMAIGIMSALPAVAAPKANKPQGPVNVEADRGAFDLKAKAHHFQGNVRVTQSDFAVSADQVWVQGEPGRQSVRAMGSPVKVEWPTENIKATALRADYQQATGELKLSGNVRLDQNGNVLESEQIRYLFTTRTAVAEGGGRNAAASTTSGAAGTGRVHMRWMPEELPTSSKKSSSDSEAEAPKSKTSGTP